MYLFDRFEGFDYSHVQVKNWARFCVSRVGDVVGELFKCVSEIWLIHTPSTHGQSVHLSSKVAKNDKQLLWVQILMSRESERGSSQSTPTTTTTTTASPNNNHCMLCSFQKFDWTKKEKEMIQLKYGNCSSSICSFRTDLFALVQFGWSEHHLLLGKNHYHLKVQPNAELNSQSSLPHQNLGMHPPSAITSVQNIDKP